MASVLKLSPWTLESSDNLSIEKEALLVKLGMPPYTLHMLDLWDNSVSYWYMQTWFILKIEPLQSLATEFYVTQHAAKVYDLPFISSTENEDYRMVKSVLTRFWPVTGKLVGCQNLAGPLQGSICSHLC